MADALPLDPAGALSSEQLLSWNWFNIATDLVAFVGFGDEKSKWGNVNSASVFQCPGMANSPTLHCYTVPNRPVGRKGCCPLLLHNRVATFLLGSK